MATYLMNDLYTASGSAKLFGCWTESVTKHTPSNFYNYEEDNLPLYDLDERDELLWEQLGYPTSSIPGMVLLVSADAPAESVACNKNIFHDLSSLQKALPKYLNYPLIIEVASFGDLGELNIKDITMGPSGSLEIINRLNHAVPFVTIAVEASATSRVSTGPHASYPIWKNVAAGQDSTFYSFISNNYGFSPSSLLLSSYVMSGGVAIGQFKTDERALTSFKGFYSNRPAAQEVTNHEFARLSVADLTLPLTWPSPTAMNITGSVYEEQTLSEIYSYDPSCFNQSTGSETYRDFAFAVDEPTIYQRFVAYGNYLRKITVSDCNGPLYIRGFYCSGDGATTEIGVEVTDSTVSFEGLAVDHFVSKGISIKNSTVDFKRDLFVNRCYGLDSGGNRLSGDWLTVNSKSFDAPKDDSAGIEALNSEIFFDTTEEHTTPLATANGAVFNAGLYLRVISRNSTGMRLVNSLVRGGSSRPTNRLNSVGGVYYMDFLSFEGNANYGLEIENSRFRFEGRLEVFNNTRGIRSANSNFNVEEFSIENNQIYGLFLDNSEFRYNLNGVSATDRFDFDSLTLNPQYRYTKQYSYKFKDNGQHLIMRNSTFRPSRYPHMESYYGRMIMVDAHGISDDNTGSLLPAVQMDSSLAEFIHLTSLRPGISGKVAKGAHIYASNNSEVNCLGTASSICAFIAGSATPIYNQMKHYAALCVEDGSTIKFRGPNVVYDGAVNVYANKNSNIVFEPHKKQNGEFDIEGFSLNDPRSHTMIELKGYNSCLVADRNSTIVIEDLGDFTTTWDSADVGISTYVTDSAGFNFAPYTSAGFFQFYPNPNEAIDYSDPSFSQVRQTRGSECRMTLAGIGQNKYYFGEDPWTNDPYHLDSVTQGGMCLRALNNSNVRVRNVHFPCGYWNASSVYYDTSAADEYCSRLFIWNVANNSTMHVDHVSVSGVYPASAGYHGPSAVWASGTTQAAYGLPSGTPDTSSLSILDFFGVGSGVTAPWIIPDGTFAMYGQISWENQGPFRLYVGVDSMANSMVHMGGVGIIQQIYAQGYAPSGPAYLLAEASSIYGKAVHINDNGNYAISGYYYPDQMVKCDPNSIMLDESAANLFANAKNGAMGTSRRPQICTIYYATNTNYGEGRAATSGIRGKGFKSCNIFDLLEEN